MLDISRYIMIYPHTHECIRSSIWMAVPTGKTPAGGLIHHFSHVRRWQGQSTPARASVVKAILLECSSTEGIQRWEISIFKVDLIH
jgi:hypothetical protein